MSLLVKLQAYITKSNTPPWAFFMFLKLCKWYQMHPTKINHILNTVLKEKDLSMCKQYSWDHQSFLTTETKT